MKLRILDGRKQLGTRSCSPYSINAQSVFIILFTRQTQRWKQVYRSLYCSTVIFSLRCNQLTEFVHKQVQKIGLHVLKTVAQKELAEGSHKKNSSFLFFAGEILEDVFLLTQNTLKVLFYFRFLHQSIDKLILILYRVQAGNPSQLSMNA